MHIGCIGIISESCCHVLSDTCIIISSERVGRVNVSVSSDAQISTLLDRIADKLTCNFILELNIKVSYTKSLLSTCKGRHFSCAKITYSNKTMS